MNPHHYYSHLMGILDLSIVDPALLLLREKASRILSMGQHNQAQRFYVLQT
jgi:hypothetical protein